MVILCTRGTCALTCSNLSPNISSSPSVPLHLFFAAIKNGKPPDLVTSRYHLRASSNFPTLALSKSGFWVEGHTFLSACPDAAITASSPFFNCIVLLYWYRDCHAIVFSLCLTKHAHLLLPLLAICSILSCDGFTRFETQTAAQPVSVFVDQSVLIGGQSCHWPKND